MFKPMQRKEKVILAASALFILLLTAAAAVSSCAGGGSGFPVVINEVVSSNSQSLTEATLGSPDWIELYNRGKRSVSLKGCCLSNQSKAGGCVFGDVTIPAGGYLIVYASKNGEAGAGVPLMNFNISKAGEVLYLLGPGGMLLQQLAVPALLTDESYARGAGGVYGLCLSPTPGAANDDGMILDAEAVESKPASDALVLNEVLPRSPGGTAWAELKNTGTAALDLSAYCLTDSAGNPDKWRLPRRTLAPGEYIVAEFGGNGEDGALAAPFKLGSSDTALYLYDVTGNALGSLQWPAGIPEGLSAVAGSGYSAAPTKGTENAGNTFPTALPVAMDAADTVRISEVLVRNRYGLKDGAGDRPEWVELHNSGDKAVSLLGWYLSDDADKLFKWAFPDTTIEAGGYRVVFLSGKQGTADEPHASFRLSAGEAGVYLTSADFRVDSFTLAETADDISAGRDTSGGALFFRSPTPSAANGAGVADASLLGCFDKSGVYISEVCAANVAKSGKNDWIELYNGSPAPVDLSGCYLSDDADEKLKWRIPKLTVAPGAYAVIETTSNAERQNANTATFGISPLGETLFLSDREGNTMDVFDTGTLRAGVTSGRVEGNDKLARVYFGTPTRGRQNAADYSEGYTAKPSFSQAGLYQSAEFQLAITSDTPGAKIYYTTDGTPPTTAASKAYTGPITISKNTPVRAVACSGGLLPSDIATVTYLFETPHTVPVFCITGKPREMKTVIESDQQRVKPEYAAYVEYYETDGTLGVAFPSSVRPKGRASLRMPQNSLALALGGNYGQSSVTYPFFSGGELTSYSSLALRTSGQDTPAARMRDTYFQRVERNLNVDSIQTKLVVVYVNGQYNGLFDLNEEQDADYFASYYGVDANNIEIINSNAIAVAGDNREYKRIYKIAEEWSMKDDAVFAEFAKLVDTEACIDYLASQTYFGNGDLVNVRFWRTKDYSIRWRPILFDLDFSLRFNDKDRNVFDRYLIPEPTISGGSVIVEMHIFGALMQNKAWRDRFVERFVELAYTEFNPERILNVFDGLKAEMQPEMAKTIEKWRMPSSLDYWEDQTAKLRAALEARQAIALKQMQRYFRVSDEKMRELTAKYSKTSG